MSRAWKILVVATDGVAAQQIAKKEGYTPVYAQVFEREAIGISEDKMLYEVTVLMEEEANDVKA